MTPYDPTDHGDIWDQTAAAVAYLAGMTRPGLTVWDALDEAVRDWLGALHDVDTGTGGSPWDDPDPLRTSLGALLGSTAPAGSPGGDPLGDVLSAALAGWVQQTAEDVNDGHRFTVSW